MFEWACVFFLFNHNLLCALLFQCGWISIDPFRRSFYMTLNSKRLSMYVYIYNMRCVSESVLTFSRPKAISVLSFSSSPTLSPRHCCHRSKCISEILFISHNGLLIINYIICHQLKRKRQYFLLTALFLVPPCHGFNSQPANERRTIVNKPFCGWSICIPACALAAVVAVIEAASFWCFNFGKYLFARSRLGMCVLYGASQIHFKRRMQCTHIQCSV